MLNLVIRRQKSNLTYDIQYVNPQNNNVDYFSKLPLTEELKAEDLNITHLNFVASYTDLPVDKEQIKSEIVKDKVLVQVSNYIKVGWPRKVKPELKTYSYYKNNLSEINVCVMLGHKVVVPMS